MSDQNEQLTQLFFEVFESLPRQGPGNLASATKALALCHDLPHSPSVIDLGCGTGGQTLQLAELLSGTFVAVDSHAPNIECLSATVTERGLSNRISPVVGDFENLEQPSDSFDLVWSEGALYNLGLQSALDLCHRLLRTQGYLAFTDAVWRKENAPPEIKEPFEEDYPTMGQVEDVFPILEQCGFALIDHFTLPDEAWWDDFYTPMLQRVQELRTKYAGDDEVLSALDQLEEEPKTHKKYSDYYAYEFFVARRVR